MTSSSNDYGETPATSPGPEMAAEGDTDQLHQEDTLLDRGLESVIDEGSSPPERPPNPDRLETEVEQYEGESIADRVEREEPEVWETDGEPDAGAREPDRAGRLAADDQEASGASATSLMADDVGVAGGAASAEEAAVHVLDEDQDRT